MDNLFASLLEMSLSGSIVILLVLAMRLVLKKAPARLVCLLWLLAGIRLLLPLHIETNFSLQPDMEELLTPVVTEYVPQYIDSVAPEDLEQLEPVEFPADADTMFVEYEVQHPVHWTTVAAYVWALGAGAMLIYTVVSYIKLKWQVRTAVRAADGAWECDRLNGAFLLGYLKPRIFLPTDLSGEDREYVMSHERTHIAWGDHWTKLIGFLCLSIHWFNPLVWLGYRLLCRDLEMACDEQVVRRYDAQGRKAYSKALLSCSVESRSASACPIAFGEVNVKERIMKILNYRKPEFWICLICVVAAIGTAVFFLTDPLKEMTMEDYVTLIGMEKNELLDKLDVDEEDVIYSETSRLYLLPDTVQFNGREYQIYCDMGEMLHNQAASFKFFSKTNGNQQTSIEDFAQEFLNLQTQFLEQFGEPRLSNHYTEPQQIVEAYDNRRKSEIGGWNITTSWEIYEGIPYSNIVEFLKEMLTWDIVDLLAQQNGRKMEGLMRISLEGTYVDGAVVFWIKYSAAVMPGDTTTIKYGTVFEEYASRLGRYNEKFFTEQEVDEYKITYTDNGAVMRGSIEYEGIDLSIHTRCVEEMEDRVTVAAFVISPSSLDETADNYLQLLESLKEIYGEPTEVSNYVSDFAQLREAFDKKETVINPVMSTRWLFDQGDDAVSSQVRYNMSELVKTDYAKEIIKKFYGDDAIPDAEFEVVLTCHAGVGESDDNGVITEFESYTLNVIFSIELVPEYQ